VKAKDELATVLVSVLQSIDATRDFLVEIVMDEVKNGGKTNGVFTDSVIFSLKCSIFYIDSRQRSSCPTCSPVIRRTCLQFAAPRL